MLRRLTVMPVPALRALSFSLPGKPRGFRVRDLADAKTWLAVDDSTKASKP